jgi:hypothetical protein
LVFPPQQSFQGIEEMQRRPNSITFLDTFYVLRGASKRGRDVLHEVRQRRLLHRAEQ